MNTLAIWWYNGSGQARQKLWLH